MKGVDSQASRGWVWAVFYITCVWRLPGASTQFCQLARSGRLGKKANFKIWLSRLGYLRDLTPGTATGLFSRGLGAGGRDSPRPSRSTQANPRVGESGENQGLAFSVPVCSGHRRCAFLRYFLYTFSDCNQRSSRSMAYRRSFERPPGTACQPAGAGNVANAQGTRAAGNRGR